MLTASAMSMRGAPAFIQGAGELDLNQLLSARAPGALVTPVAPVAPATRRGRTAEARSSSRAAATHLSLDGVVLQGERTIFGLPFNSAAMAALEAAG